MEVTWSFVAKENMLTCKLWKESEVWRLTDLFTVGENGIYYYISWK